MELKRREFSEKTLKQLFIGSQLDGVKFGPGPGSLLIRFMHYTNKQPDDLWVNIESKWTVFSTINNNYPNSEDEIEDLTEEDEYSLVFKLRREKVIDIKLGETVPHLIIVFESGLTMFINGHHDMYECWQAGDGTGNTGEDWLIVATPGDDIATWVPNDSKLGENS
ncbi:hypothetical protein [Robertmurraya korlensis]|uniref:hypothetical protein n=1 Tax=Robertmurraya korlensis TaxID=519977 RepID=UPI000824C857|nr:hypothetical protein [Robertmurraya korlensis]